MNDMERKELPREKRAGALFLSFRSARLEQSVSIAAGVQLHEAVDPEPRLGGALRIELYELEPLIRGCRARSGAPFRLDGAELGIDHAVFPAVGAHQ